MSDSFSFAHVFLVCGLYTLFFVNFLFFRAWWRDSKILFFCCFCGFLKFFSEDV
jgi:hypothetical protein